LKMGKPGQLSQRINFFIFMIYAFQNRTMRGDCMPTKFCPHCGKRTGFQVTFNVSCRIGDEEEKAYLRECQDCGGRFITIQKDERMEDVKGQSTPD